MPAGVRFQVSLPTPLAVISSFFHGDDRAAIEPVYTSAIVRELDRILAAIPHEDLAVQWDVASEMGIIERAAGYGSVMEAWWPGDPFDGLVSRLAVLVDAVPADVEVGVHLCYGDAGRSTSSSRGMPGISSATRTPWWPHPIVRSPGCTCRCRSTMTTRRTSPRSQTSPRSASSTWASCTGRTVRKVPPVASPPPPRSPRVRGRDRVRHRPRARRIDRGHPAHACRGRRRLVTCGSRFACRPRVA